jgi:hypothetical protein
MSERYSINSMLPRCPWAEANRPSRVMRGGRTTDWPAGKGDALRFDAMQYYEILREANLMESFIAGQWGVMGEMDRQARQVEIGLRGTGAASATSGKVVTLAAADAHATIVLIVRTRRSRARSSRRRAARGLRSGFRRHR